MITTVQEFFNHKVSSVWFYFRSNLLKIKPCMKQELPKARKRSESYKNLWQIGISGENLQLGSGEVTMLGGVERVISGSTPSYPNRLGTPRLSKYERRFYKHRVGSRVCIQLLEFDPRSDLLMLLVYLCKGRKA